MEPTDAPRTTTTINIHDPGLEIADKVFPKESVRTAQIHFHRDEFSELRSATIVVSPPSELRWDYHGEAKLYDGSELILTGRCSSATEGENGTLHLTLEGVRWKLTRTHLPSVETFGMSHKEILHWVVRLTDPAHGLVIPDLELDTRLRPFAYAIPLRGLEDFDRDVLPMGDVGMASRDNDNMFGPLLEQAESVNREGAWSSENPRVFGVVAAEDIIQAERLALERANLAVSIINLALRTGMSHLETRYECEPLLFDADDSLTPVSLHPWIIIREVNEPKGWIRKTTPANIASETRSGAFLDRVELFLSQFSRARESGDIHEQLGNRPLADREKKLETGIQRALHWLNNAAGEGDVRDQFTATWISLEAILNSITYPGVFENERSAIKASIRNSIRSISLPKSSNVLLELDTEMLLNRALHGRWSPSQKLAIFGSVFGISVNPGDAKLVRKLGRARASIFHEGEEDPSIYSQDLKQLRYLVERLVVGAAIGGYEDLEDEPHRFQVGEIGPEGGAAPLAIDGRDVPYDLHMFRDGGGQLVAEWVAEGKIYTEKNMHFAGQGGDS